MPASSLTLVIQDLYQDHAAVQCEIVELLTNDILQTELKTGDYHFWNMFSDTDYAALKKCVQKVMSFFVGMNTCESTFSTMNIVKRMQRNRLTNAHLDCLTRIAVTNYNYSMKKGKMGLTHFRSSHR